MKDHFLHFILNLAQPINLHQLSKEIIPHIKLDVG